MSTVYIDGVGLWRQVGGLHGLPKLLLPQLAAHGPVQVEHLHCQVLDVLEQPFPLLIILVKCV